MARGAIVKKDLIIKKIQERGGIKIDMGKKGQHGGTSH